MKAIQVSLIIGISIFTSGSALGEDSHDGAQRINRGEALRVEFEARGEDARRLEATKNSRASDHVYDKDRASGKRVALPEAADPWIVKARKKESEDADRKFAEGFADRVSTFSYDIQQMKTQEEKETHKTLMCGELPEALKIMEGLLKQAKEAFGGPAPFMAMAELGKPKSGSPRSQLLEKFLLLSDQKDEAGMERIRDDLKGKGKLTDLNRMEAILRMHRAYQAMQQFDLLVCSGK